MKLSNRTVLVTGGTSGIGLGIAEAFQQSKSRVIVCGRNKEKLSAVKEKFPDITAIPCDVGDAQAEEETRRGSASPFSRPRYSGQQRGDTEIYRSEKRI